MAVEALGAAFAALVIVYSVWFAYQWGIKPDRDARRRKAHHDVEEMHQGHWKTWRLFKGRKLTL